MTDMPERIWATPFDPEVMEGGTYCNAATRPTAPNHDAWCYRRADLPPKVKPLEWAKSITMESTSWFALGFNSEYQIVAFSHGVTLWRDGWTGEWQEAESVEAATAAVQADYETRILAALVQP